MRVVDSELFLTSLIQRFFNATVDLGYTACHVVSYWLSSDLNFCPGVAEFGDFGPINDSINLSQRPGTPCRKM